MSNIHTAYKLKSTGQILVISYDDELTTSREWDNLGVIEINGNGYLDLKEGQETFDETLVAYEIDVYIYSSSQGRFTLGKKIETEEEFENAKHKIYITEQTFDAIGTEQKNWESALKGELETLTQEYTGEVYCYNIYTNDQMLEVEYSCFGFYSTDDIISEFGGKENLEEVKIKEKIQYYIDNK